MTRVALAEIACVVVVCAGLGVDAQRPAMERQPLEIARVLAARYPENPTMSYIPALSWSGALRVAALSGEDSWKQKPRRDMRPFIEGEKVAIAEPYQLTSLAGHLAFSDLAATETNAGAAALARKAADFIVTDPKTWLPPSPGAEVGTAKAAGGSVVRFARGWTDDMFMATALLARVAARDLPAAAFASSATSAPREAGSHVYALVVGRLLTSYAEKLQRADGLFIHAADGPHAWGRGNGFAAWGLVEALTWLPESWPDRSRVLEIYRRQMRALAAHQSDDGSWRQVVDEPSSYRELTVTAMTVAAMARGVRRGWLDRDVLPAIDRGWRAVAARVGDDGTVRDVCAGTGAGPTKEYYLNRPVINGADDRGGAMALLAALEVEELRRSMSGR